MKYTHLTLIACLLSFTSYAVIGPINGATPFCPGNSITLSDTTLGGTWTSSNTGLATVGAGTGVVTGVSSGIVTITYTTGTGYVTASVTINPFPNAYSVTGGGGYCAGGSGVTVGLAGSQTSISYQLYNGATMVGSPFIGNGFAFNSPAMTSISPPSSGSWMRP